MARPVGDEHLARPGAAEGNGCEPDPAHPADEAEDAARQAVEGIGITVNPGHDRPPPRAAGTGEFDNRTEHGRCVAGPGTQWLRGVGTVVLILVALAIAVAVALCMTVNAPLGP